MSERTAQLNIPEESGWVFVPYAFIGAEVCGRKKPQAALLVESMVYSFSDPESSRVCRQSYADMRERLGICNDTVARSIRLLTACGAVEQDKSRRVCAEYSHSAPSRGLSGVEVPDFLLTEEFIIRGKKRRDGSVTPQRVRTLRPMEAVILSEIRRAQKNGAKDYATSDSRLAKKFRLNKSTVNEYITALIRSGLLYRAQEGRGCNGRYLSRYTVNEKLLRVLRKRKARENKEKQGKARETLFSVGKLTGDERARAVREIAERNARNAAFDARTEREHWYAVRRQEAEDRARRYLRIAEQDEAYSAAQKAVKRLDIAIAKAEVFRLPDLEALRRERLEQCAVRARRLAALHIGEEDLRPAWRCKKCEDTGFEIGTGRPCSCYSPPKGDDV